MFKPCCECPHNDGTELLPLNWEEFMSLKAHYKSKNYAIMRMDCKDYRYGEYHVVESTKRWKVVRYDG